MASSVQRLRSFFRGKSPVSTDFTQGFAFSRPLVLLQSDDWGRVGVRDRDGYEFLRARGMRLGEHPYDLYTLETADDLNALSTMLNRHRDASGHSPCLIMNFCASNLDFDRMRDQGNRAIRFLPLAKGLPGKWSRPGLLEAYREGIESGVFRAGLHGVSHFSQIAVENALAMKGERQKLLQLFWEAETPFIYWRMRWVGYEYWNPEEPRAGFLLYQQQQELLKQAAANVSALFGVRPVSACAPGYRANHDTQRAWSNAGIRVAQNGTGHGLRAPHIDEFGILHTYRAADFEPSQHDIEVEKYLEIARACFSKGLPFIISVHAINFHSTLKDYRSAAICELNSLLTALEAEFQDLLYVNDEELYEIVTSARLRSRGENAEIVAPRGERRHAAVSGKY